MEKNKMENNKAMNCGGLRMMSRKERYEYLINQVTGAKQKLCVANAEESVNLALDELANLMNSLHKDSQVADVKGCIADIAGTVHAVKLHDATRSVLDDMLLQLIKASEAIIAEEKKKEYADKLKILFLALAEHSEEIAAFIGYIDILG